MGRLHASSFGCSSRGRHCLANAQRSALLSSAPAAQINSSATKRRAATSRRPLCASRISPKPAAALPLRPCGSVGLAGGRAGRASASGRGEWMVIVSTFRLGASREVALAGCSRAAQTHHAVEAKATTSYPGWATAWRFRLHSGTVMEVAASLPAQKIHPPSAIPARAAGTLPQP